MSPEVILLIGVAWPYLKVKLQDLLELITEIDCNLMSGNITLVVLLSLKIDQRAIDLILS